MSRPFNIIMIEIEINYNPLWPDANACYTDSPVREEYLEEK